MEYCSDFFKRLLHRHASLATALLIYSSLCFLLSISVSGNVTSITSDFDFYNSAVVRGLGDWTSPMARALFEESAYVDPQYRYGWIATPFYSYIFLSPVWLLGSQFAFGLMGWSIGAITLFGFYRILRDKLRKLPAKFEMALMALIALNFNFLVDSFAVSTMSVAAMFGVLAFTGSSRWLRIIMLCCVAMTRSNYIVALASAFLALLLFRPQGWKDLLIDFSPSVAVTAVFYALFYSTYPGSGLNYILSTVYQGLDYAQPMGVELANSILGIQTEESLLRAQLSLGNLLALLGKAETWAYIFNVWALKLSVSLGLIHEKLFQSEHGFWLAKAWRTAYFLLASLPGMYGAFLLTFLRKMPRQERAIYGWGLFYLAFNSILIGDPRYLMGVYFFLVLALMRLLSLITVDVKSA